LQTMFPKKGGFAPPTSEQQRKLFAQEAYDEAMAEPLTAQAHQDEDDGHFEFIATATYQDTSLGFGTCNMPPQVVYVHQLEKRGWADNHGVREHDELYMIDDHHVEDMLAEDLVKCLKNRPVRLTFARELPEGQVGEGDATSKSRHDDDHHHDTWVAPHEQRLSEEDELKLTHRQWLDTASTWFETVVESSRYMLEVADLDIFAFRNFMVTRDEDDIGNVVGIMDSRQKLGSENEFTDVVNARANKALHNQGANLEDRTDERILAALELKAGGGWLFEGAAAKAGNIFKQTLAKEATPWPTYPGEQVSALARSIRREVQGSFLCV